MMFSTPILGSICRSIVSTASKQVRTLRPSIKVGRERFQLSLDVRQYNKDEIKVKAHPEYVIIEGKQEKNTKQGYILRQFIRKFKLPEGCVPNKIESSLSPDGILTVSAPRTFSEQNVPCEAIVVPITYGPKEKEKLKEIEKVIEPEPEKPNLINPCANYGKVKPKPNK